MKVGVIKVGVAKVKADGLAGNAIRIRIKSRMKTDPGQL